MAIPGTDDLTSPDHLVFRIVQVDTQDLPCGFGAVVELHACCDDIDTAILVYEWTRHRLVGRRIMLAAGQRIIRRSWARD